MKNVLKVDNIKKIYGKKGNITTAVDGISFEVEKGEYLGIMGSSGSGKTTLLNCISTIDKPTSGKIYIDGENIASMNENKSSKFRREKLGFVFQDFNILDTMTAYENIALALAIKKVKPLEIDKRVKKVSKLLDINSVIDKYPYQMSGGQKQRVAAARAIITEPSLVLADEPTGALDSKSASMLLDSFRKLNEEMETTIVMVTHDAFTASNCKRIIFIKDGKIFSELVRGNKSRKEFFNSIMDVIALLGGDLNAE